MNPFTTDHPLTCYNGAFDRESSAWGGFFGNGVVAALLLSPVFYGTILFCAFTDESQGCDSPPFLQSWSDFFQGAAIALLFCAILVAPFIAGHRLLRFYLAIKSQVTKRKGTI